MRIEQFTEYLGISIPTIYNWKKHRPNLYQIVMDWKAKNENKKIEISESNEIKETNTKKLINFYKKLNQEDQEKLLTELELKILREELKELKKEKVSE